MKIYNPYEITFETKCYENDWEFILKSNYLSKMIRNCNVTFSFKQVIINNVKQRNVLEYYAKKNIEEKIIDAYYFVDDYIEEALEFFDIKKESFGKGYYYSSAELVGIYVARSKYLLHFSSDTYMPNKSKNNWIIEACNILEKEPNIVVANPTWDFQFDEIKKGTNGNMVGNFYIGYGFSDQCYLVRTADFKKKIYNFKHPASERYPKYGGELFEKRIDSYMQVNKKQRITSTTESYIHDNFPHKKSHKKIIKILMMINMYGFVGKLNCKLFRKYKRVLKKIKRYINW